MEVKTTTADDLCRFLCLWMEAENDKSEGIAMVKTQEETENDCPKWNEAVVANQNGQNEENILEFEIQFGCIYFWAHLCCPFCIFLFKYFLLI